MKIYIQTDLEGVAGMVCFEDTKSRTFDNYYHRQRMYKLLTGEVNAAVSGAKAAGAEVIYINDSHGSGYNIIFEELEEGCEIIHGRSSTYPTWMPCLDSSFDAVVMLGMHAMAGSKEAITPHSRWVLNDGEIYLSEGAMCMALAGYYRVPAVFASGDQTITAEMKEKNPGMEIAVVKHAFGPYSARCVLPNKAREMIFEGVKSGISRRKKIPPYLPKGPYRLNLTDSLGGRDIRNKILSKDVCGEDFMEVFQNAARQMPWNKYGSQEIDDYYYP